MRGGLGLGARLLADSKIRLLAAAAGIAMAITIMFVEAALLYGVLDSQALIATLVRGDLVVMHLERTNLHNWNKLDTIRLDQIAAVEGVDRVVPIYEGTVGLRNPPSLRVRRIIVFAFPPDDPALDIGDPAELRRLLMIPDGVLFDRRSRPIFGDIEPGHDVELNGIPQRVVGTVDLGPDVVNDGALVMSEGTWFVHERGDDPIMGAIHLKPGADPQAVRQRILAQLPHDVAVFAPAELREREIAFTLHVAPVGVLFGIGMLAALVIGSFTCYQVLFNEVVDRFAAYSTLKAMGFSNFYLRRIIVEQALLLSWAGLAIGAALAAIVDHYIARSTYLAIPPLAASLPLILCVGTAMCVGAGLLAVERVIRSDPAELY
jgi:putative ABC transport system permease protein